MKKIALLAFIGFSSAAVFAQHNEHDGHNHGVQIKEAAAPAKGEDVLQIKEMMYDFGKIPQGKPVFHQFEIFNTGKVPLKLENVQAACGCTTPEWSRESIAPGEKSVIKVGYNAAAEGYFDKPITITYNGISKQIKITGTVWKAPAGAAPANASVQFLKKQDL